MSFLDPFGTDAKKEGVEEANAALQAAANAFGTSLGKIDYNVSPDQVSRYMSPDVAFRQNAATQALGQLYGNSGALRSSAAQSGIMNANANIAAQAWNDAFGRASGIQGQNNNIALQSAQNQMNAAQGQAANSAAAAMADNGWLTNAAGAIGNIGQGVGGILSVFKGG